MVGVLLVGVLWGSAPTGTVIALDGLNVWDISFLRAVFASLVLLLFLRNLSFLKMSRDEFLKISLLGIYDDRNKILYTDTSLSLG
jgi:drug/metabolite transporter (DMT)-like permease